MSSKLLTDTYKHVKRTANIPTNKRTEKRNAAGDNVIEIQLLKQFDLNWEYGPCTGITRMERWERAEKHGLNPPNSVKDLIQQHPNDEVYTKSLWKDYDL